MTEKISDQVIAKKIEINIEEELDQLYDIIVPVTLNKHDMFNVEKEIVAYFKKFNTISINAVACACADLYRWTSQYMVKVRDEERVKMGKVQKALEQYQFEQSRPIKDLGFGIITTSAADAALYSAMSAHNIAKQRIRNNTAAEAAFVRNLEGVKADSIMSDHDIEEFKYELRKALERLQTYAERKYFIDTHSDFYTSTKFNNGLKENGHSIYKILCNSAEYSGICFEGRWDQEAVLKALVEKGYLETVKVLGYEKYWFCTTLKYEHEVLAELAQKENPETYAQEQAIQKETEQKKLEATYNQALENYEKGLFYEAATALGTIPEYKDAMERSLKIWYDKLLCNGWFYYEAAGVIADAVALKDDGTVYHHRSHNKEYLGKTETWHGVQKVFDPSTPFALTVDGRVLSVKKDILTFADKKDDWSKWTNLTDLVSEHYSIFGLRKDGKVYAMGHNEQGKCNVEGAENVAKVVVASARSAMLTKDGKVLVFGEPATGYENWENIVDIAIGNFGLCGLKQDGSVEYVSFNDMPMYGAHPSTWKNVYRLLPNQRAISKDGTLYCWEHKEEIALKLQNISGIADMIDELEYIACIKADGSILPITAPEYIAAWENVVSLKCGMDYIVGLKADGTFIGGGKGYRGGIENWKLFDHINNRKDIKQTYMAMVKQQYQKELQDAKCELENLKGLFASMRKKKLEERIVELEAVLR